MTRSLNVISGAAVVALGLNLASAAWANTDRAEQDPAVGGGANSCWGEVASGTARLEEQASMGRHSMSTQAANKQDGFASDSNGFGITFNVKDDGETNAGRQGVGNVSADLDQNHATHPGDGGNGVHAQNNAEASNILDPVTGDIGGLSDGQTLGCDEIP